MNLFWVKIEFFFKCNAKEANIKSIQLHSSVRNPNYIVYPLLTQEKLKIIHSTAQGYDKDLIMYCSAEVVG